jgi:hypothetical protein
MVALRPKDEFHQRKIVKMDLVMIQNRIYEVNGIKIMLDYDLASLYEVETRVLNQAIKRNKDSFPDDFMFQLTTEEWELLSSQIVTSSSQIVMMEIPKNRTGKYLPILLQIMTLQC